MEARPSENLSITPTPEPRQGPGGGKKTLLAPTGDILGISWGYFGDILKIFWGYFGDSLGIFWGYFGDILGIFWGYFGNILGKF